MSYCPSLQKPLQLGDLTLKNRVIMAPLTRNRGVIPNQANIDYYTQRASAGLIVSEGLLIEPQGTEWTQAPGIWNKKQIKGYKKVTDSVHSQGGLIFAQLWHVGRIANHLHNAGQPPAAPSSKPAKGGKFRLLHGVPGYSIPEEIDDPKEYIDLFKQAAENAKLAGFDGIEIHGGGGFLIQQFIESHSNLRDDEYGGDIANRCRFAIEVIDAVTEVFSSKRVGFRVNPSGGYNDMGEASEQLVLDTYSYLIDELDKRDLGYIHLNRWIQAMDRDNRGTKIDIMKFKPYIQNSLLFVDGEFSAEEAEGYVNQGKSDAVVFGRYFMSNPDLPYRFFHSIPLDQPNFKLTYVFPEGAPHIGYSDYPCCK